MLTDRHQSIRKRRGFQSPIWINVFYDFSSYGDGDARRTHFEIEFEKKYTAWTWALKKKPIPPCWIVSLSCVHMGHLT